MMKTPCTIVTKVPAGKKDEQGDETTKEVEVETKCSLQPAGRAGVGGRSEHVEISDTTWALFLPWGAQLEADAEVIVDGRRFEVIGEPWTAEEGSPGLWHVEATVQRIAGTGEA